MEFKEVVSTSLKRFRKEFKLNQREVAKAISIPYQSYQAYEYGKSVPSSEVISKLADAYNVSTDYLLGRSENPQPTNFDEKEVREAFKARDKFYQMQEWFSNKSGSQPQVPAQ